MQKLGLDGRGGRRGRRGMARRERRGTVVILASALAFITSGNYLDDIRFVIVRICPVQESEIESTVSLFVLSLLPLFSPLHLPSISPPSSSQFITTTLRS